MNTPSNVSIEFIDQCFGNGSKELSEHIDDGIEGMVTCGGHPLDFLSEEGSVMTT